MRGVGHRWVTPSPNVWLSHLHTSGHDYLDAQRASCLMNTYWNAEAISNYRALSLHFSTAWFDCVSSVCFNSACCGSSNSISNYTFPGLEFESQSRSFFSVFFLLPTFCHGRSMEIIFLHNFIDWLTQVVIGVTSQKIASTGIRTPDLETWNLMWHWNCRNILHCSTRLTRSQTSL